MKPLFSVRTRVISAVFVFAASLFVLVQYQYESKIKGILYGTEQSKYETLANTVIPILAINLAFDLQEENSRYMDELIAMNPDLVTMILYDNRHQPLVEKGRTVPSQALVSFDKALVDPQKGSKLGTVEFTFVNHALEMTEKEHRSFIIRFVAAAVVLLLLLIVILDRAFRPLHTLLAWMRRFDPKKDDISSMPAVHCKEARMIETSMLQMFERIRHYTQELDALNRNLDDKVRRRTNALAEANAQLEEEIRIREAAEEELKQANARLTELSRSDALTGIANRRYFQEHLQERWAVCVREKIPLTLVICDIDHFKAVNDTYGHPAGDVVIRAIALTIREEIKRSSDLVARFGGEEFAIILFDTHLADALTLVKRIQERIRSLDAFSPPAETVRGVTLSFGICSHVPAQGDALDKYVVAADRALYRAKEAGRDRIIFVAYDAEA